jgi:hypothetical protein
MIDRLTRYSIRPPAAQNGYRRRRDAQFLQRIVELARAPDRSHRWKCCRRSRVDPAPWNTRQIDPPGREIVVPRQGTANPPKRSEMGKTECVACLMGFGYETCTSVFTIQ